MDSWRQVVPAVLLSLCILGCRGAKQERSNMAMPNHLAVGCWEVDAHLVDTTYLRQKAHFELDTLVLRQDTIHDRIVTGYRLVPGEGARIGRLVPKLSGWRTEGDSISFGWGDGFNGYVFLAVVSNDSLHGIGRWVTDYGPPGPLVPIYGSRMICEQE
jgi:hypothetical protein